MSTPTPGRRTAGAPAGGSVDVTLLMAVGLPLLVLLAALLVRPGEVARTGVRAGGDPPHRRDGDLSLRATATSWSPTTPRRPVRSPSGRAARRRPTRLAPQRPTEVDERPGAGRGRRRRRPRARACWRAAPVRRWSPPTARRRRSTSGSPASVPAPSTRRSWSWSTPTQGAAVVDVLAYGARGLIDAPVLRGRAVPGRSVVRIDLAQKLPRRDDLALHVRTTRGRVSAAVLDTYDELGTAARRPTTCPPSRRRRRPTSCSGCPEGTGRRIAAAGQPGRDRDPGEHQGRDREVDLRRRRQQGRRRTAAERGPGVDLPAAARPQRARRARAARRVVGAGDRDRSALHRRRPDPSRRRRNR